MDTDLGLQEVTITPIIIWDKCDNEFIPFVLMDSDLGIRAVSAQSSEAIEYYGRIIDVFDESLLPKIATELQQWAGDGKAVSFLFCS